MGFFSSLPLDWADDLPVFIVGGGPSLKDFDLSQLYCRGRVVGVNGSLWKTRCDCGFSMDGTWPLKEAERLENPPCEIVLSIVEKKYEKLKHLPAIFLRRDRGEGLSLDPCGTYGSNSGYSALNMAVLRGAKKIYLLGFDMKLSPEGKPHWHESYVWHNTVNHRQFPSWADNFYDAASDCRKLGVQVYNCNPDSAVHAFPKIELSSLLSLPVVR